MPGTTCSGTLRAALPSPTTSIRVSQARWGGAVGTGIEVGFAPGWSVGVEYDHLFMGSSNLNFMGTPAAGGGFNRTDSIKQDVDMATVRVNYTFGGPVVARY